MEIVPVKSPRKLIEVALPLDSINEAAVREKSMRHGHPSALHLWWARRPLAAARAVLFAQLVNDPGTNIGRGFKYGMEKKKAAIERKRLFKIIEALVEWENSTNETVLERARAEIRRSWREVCELNKDHPHAADLFNPKELPSFHDPFAGGGAIPLEAQRLGLKSYASDLNPIAVLIEKAMIEIPPKFSGRPPVNPAARSSVGVSGSWRGATGLAEDLRYYGEWMSAEAHKRIGHLYPDIRVTPEIISGRSDLKPLLDQKLTVIAWLWARTVKSPNPAFSEIDVPLASTFILASKAGKEAYVRPVIQGRKYEFSVETGKILSQAREGTKASGRGASFRCLLSGSPIDGDYIKAEGQAGRMGARLMAVVAEGPQGRVFLAPQEGMEAVAQSAKPTWKPSGNVPARLTGGTCVPYGLKEWGDLFTPRQLVALTTFSDLVSEVRELIRKDAIIAGFPDTDGGAESTSIGANAYAESVGVYLSFLIGQLANHSSTLCGWNHPNTQMRSVFSRQAIAMTWDYAEVNVFSESSGSYRNLFDRQVKGLETLGFGTPGVAFQADAQSQSVSEGKIVSTDPPYYDNIAYADLSDFFYVWQRRALRKTYPALLATIAVPKTEELVATAYRHGGKDKAEAFFLNGMTAAMTRLAEQAHPAWPVTIYYAFKQSETVTDSGTSSSGWETFLDAVFRAGFALVGTWPMRTEKQGRSIQIGVNALASSIILVCRKRPLDAPNVSRREFLRELNMVLPEALDEMTKGTGDERSPVAPVDLSQAIIGPGMAVFSKYAAVLEADGSRMSVKTALQLINRFFAEDDFDRDTQFCLQWFEQHGWNSELFGEADVLARAKGTSVDGVKQAGVVATNAGKVRLLKWSEYPSDWDPESDSRLPVWEALHHLIRAHRTGGDIAAGRLLAATKKQAEAARQLAYRLYTLCERTSRKEDARAYNELITSWSGIESAAGQVAGDVDLFGDSV